MKTISINISAIVLYIVGAFIISGSSVWMIMTDSSSIPEQKITIASSNLVSVFSIGVGAILTHVDIFNKHKELKRLRNQQTSG